jgi:pimeloyl-ACP methyl ester carboxylesterase
MPTFSRVLRRITPILLAIASVSLIEGASSEAAQAESSWQRITCPFDVSKGFLAVECGRLKVPENYDAPRRNVQIAFMIVHAKRNIDPDHPVIFLSGGPGAPLLVYAEMLVADPQINDIVVDRDWVFYDQRGAGRSVPMLLCKRAKDYLRRVKDCRDKFIKEGVDLSQYNSARSAQDIEALRRALGVKQWNLWGISYGSRLAFAVAREFPAGVHAIVHDGPSYPKGQEIINDFRGTDIAINRLLSKCAIDKACASRYQDLRARFLAALSRLRQKPLKVGDERIDDSALIQYIRGYLFTGAPAIFEARVQNLLAYMDAAARDDAHAMRQIKQKMPEENEGDFASVPVEGWYDLGQNLSIECNEERPFESLGDYKRAAAKSEIVRAMFGKRGGVEMFQDCAIWPSGKANPSVKSRVYFDGPQLAFSGELDASLSGLSGYQIAMLYPNARNVVFKNATHGQVELADLPPKAVNDYRACALKLARQFLADPKAALDTRCAEARTLRLVQ